MNEELLKQAVDALQAIAAKNVKSNLGFGVAPSIQTVFVGREDESQSLWYFLDQSSNRQDIESNTITGFVKKLEYRESEYKGRKSYKMFLQVDCKDEGLYQIRTGMGTQVELGIINSLAKASAQDLLTKPVTIALRPAEDPKLIFANVYLDGKPIYTDSRPETADYDAWKQIRRLATANVNGSVSEQGSAAETKTSDKPKVKKPVAATTVEEDPVVTDEIPF